MPRNYLDRKKYKLEDFKVWVDGQLKRNHMTQEDLGKLLGISQGRVSQMLKIPKDKAEEKKVKKDPFSYGQVLTICEYFGVSKEEKSRLLTM